MILFGIFVLLIAGISAANPARQGSCFEGDQFPHENPQKFFKCVNGRWTVETCQINYFYDEVIKFCVLFPNRPTISPPIRTCRPGVRVEYIFDNTKYKECTSDGRGFVIRSCHPGSVFMQSLSMCVYVHPPLPPTRTTTPYPTTTTTPFYGQCKESGGRDGYKPDIYNCKNFYKCASGLWTQMSCGEGTIWNQAILTCDHNRGQCRPLNPTYTPTLPTWAPSTTKYPNEFKK